LFTAKVGKLRKLEKMYLLGAIQLFTAKVGQLRKLEKMYLLGAIQEDMNPFSITDPLMYIKKLLKLS
jgi:hypothetical protein